MGLGSDASEFIEPEMSSTKMQCAAAREGLSAAATVMQRSLPDAQHLRVTSWQGGKSAENWGAIELMCC